ncbi:hypothetical protein NLG97_g1253 [Lecanicillium saksenae]|uniref:Uncharacterized protein n=1 Tax=Lecanicillium saksenae TaxID=468837 RepID=A0ACC1R5N8_9HYPO|nr:hypothetical protein NLG97_g1253 [Lecanicillium saksenae]
MRLLLWLGLVAGGLAVSTSDTKEVAKASWLQSRQSNGTLSFIDSAVVPTFSYTTSRIDNDNWIAIYTGGNPNPEKDSYLASKTSLGGASGQAEIPLLPGSYTAVFLYNNGYSTQLAPPLKFEVKPGILSKDETKAAPTFKYSVPAPKGNNWLAIYKGSNPNPKVDTAIASKTSIGTASGEVEIALPPGQYTATFLYNNGYSDQLTPPLKFEIKLGSLSRDTSVAEKITFDWATTAYDTNNWILIYTAGATGPPSTSYFLKTPTFSGGQGSTSVDLAPGNYTAYFLYNGGYTQQLAQPLDFQVDTGKLLLQDAKSGYCFDYATAKPSTSNWIAIWKKGQSTTADSYLGSGYQYAPGRSGTVCINTPYMAPGDYTAHFLANGNYDEELAQPSTFNVPWGTVGIVEGKPWLTVRYSTSNPDASNFVGVYKIGEENPTALKPNAYAYAPNAEGTVYIDTSNAKPGESKVVLMAWPKYGTYLIISGEVDITIPDTTLFYDICSEPYTIKWRTVSTESGNKIALYEKGYKGSLKSGYKAAIAAAGTTGSVRFAADPGFYDVYFLNEKFEQIANLTSVDLSPTTDESTISKQYINNTSNCVYRL